MKKLLLAFLLLLPFSAPAKAGVPCSVPFTLVNGTIADAGQVMANYNAILTCLATGAAASGVNSDITALTTLSPPITGLCGVNGLKMVNSISSPTTQITITYTQATVVNGTGGITGGFNGSLTLNLGASGAANSLDTGAIAANTVYFIYLIGNGTTIASLASTSSTTPSFPSGYSYLCRIGAWETGTTAGLLSLVTRGRRTQLIQAPTLNVAANALYNANNIGSCTTGSLVLTTFAGIPSTAARVIGAIVYANGGEAWVSSFNSVDFFSVGVELAAAVSFVSLPFDLILPSPSAFYVCNLGTTSSPIAIGGWDDNVNAN
jgi:hypothetical protein